MTFKAKIPDFLRYQDHHEQIEIEIETFTCKLYINLFGFDHLLETTVNFFLIMNSNEKSITKSNISHAFQFSFVSVDIPRQRKSHTKSRISRESRETVKYAGKKD